MKQIFISLVCTSSFSVKCKPEIWIELNISIFKYALVSRFCLQFCGNDVPKKKHHRVSSSFAHLVFSSDRLGFVSNTWTDRFSLLSKSSCRKARSDPTVFDVGWGDFYISPTDEGLSYRYGPIVFLTSMC